MTPQHIAPIVEYQSVGTGGTQIHVQEGRILVTLDGAPLWRHVVIALASMSAGGWLAVILGARGVMLWIASGPGVASLVSLALAAAFVAFCVRAAAGVWRVVRWGAGPGMRWLTSRPLARLHPGAGLSHKSDLVWVDDVAAAPGRLLYNGRRELLLRFVLADGSVRQVNWYKSRAELERLVDELRQALRLDHEAAGK